MYEADAETPFDEVVFKSCFDGAGGELPDDE
jgi:hypothetical protein